MSKIIENKSEVLFLYEGVYNEPNGDPFTGEQRYDEETKNILISDVRIKRYIRDFLDLYDSSERIYVKLDSSNVSDEGKETGAAARMKTLQYDFVKSENQTDYAKLEESLKEDEGKDKKLKNFLDDQVKKLKPSAYQILKTCIDVRLFGGISTEKGNAANITGAVQFALLNASLNKVDLRMHQNTTTFPSKMKTSSGDQQRGSIGTKTLVPYSINQIHGWVNPRSAENTGLTENDVQKMFSALWYEVNGKNTRTKSNQNSMLLVEIVYSKPYEKIYRVDKLISIKTAEGKGSEQIRSTDDYDFDFTKFSDVLGSPKVKEVNYYTEVNKIDDLLKIAEHLEEGTKSKLKKMNLYQFFKEEKL
jgi:CRISPR-associated protein Csh2